MEKQKEEVSGLQMKQKDSELRALSQLSIQHWVHREYFCTQGPMSGVLSETVAFASPSSEVVIFFTVLTDSSFSKTRAGV